MPSWTQGSVSSITLLTLTVQSVDTNTLITFYCYFTTCSTATQVGSWIQFTQQHCNNVYGSHSCIWSRARPIYWHFSLPVLSCMYVAYCTHFLYTKRLRFAGQNTERLWMVRVCITRTWTISSESLSTSATLFATPAAFATRNGHDCRKALTHGQVDKHTLVCADLWTPWLWMH